MKKAILLAVMVAVSAIATAQTLNNPISYNDFSEANSYEWFTLSDRPGDVMTYGDHDHIDELAFIFLSNVNIDYINPDTSFIDEAGDEHVVWEYVNKKLELVTFTIIKDSMYSYIIINKVKA